MESFQMGLWLAMHGIKAQWRVEFSPCVLLIGRAFMLYVSKSSKHSWHWLGLWTVPGSWCNSCSLQIPNLQNLHIHRSFWESIVLFGRFHPLVQNLIYRIVQTCSNGHNLVYNSAILNRWNYRLHSETLDGKTRCEDEGAVSQSVVQLCSQHTAVQVRPLPVSWRSPPWGTRSLEKFASNFFCKLWWCLRQFLLDNMENMVPRPRSAQSGKFVCKRCVCQTHCLSIGKYQEN